MSMYSLFYHSNIRLHISIINNIFFSKRLWYYIFAISHFVDYSFFFRVYTLLHVKCKSCSKSLNAFTLKKKCIMMSLFISPTQYCIVCKRKLRREETKISGYLNISSVQYETYFMDCILYFILILWYQSVSFNPREIFT